MNDFRQLLDLVDEMSDNSPMQLLDSVDIELSEDFVIETGVVGFMEDGIVLEADDKTLEFLNLNNVIVESQDLSERMVMGAANEPSESLDETGMVFGMGQAYNEDEELDEGQMKEKMMADAEKMSLEEFCDKYGDEDWVKEFWHTTNGEEEVDEAKYRGREVPLGKKMPGDVKKSKVYVRKPNGNVVKVEFGDKNMRIKKSNPARRRSFRARHNCDNPGPRWKARYWSCRAW